MPRLLKRDTIRLLEASVDALSLANIGLAIPRKAGSFRAAAEFGLIGTAAEQSMAACLVEAHGIEVLTRDPVTGHYKTGAQVHTEFRRLVRQRPPRAAFLFDGVGEIEAHATALIASTDRLNILLDLRAGGLHAGQGGRIDLAMAMSDDVARFLLLLSKSIKIKPYLTGMPVPSIQPQTKISLVQDLVKDLKDVTDKSQVSTLLASAFLVLPSVPENEPDWLRALDRIKVAYNKRDVSFLVNILSNALPVTFVRQSPAQSDEFLPVKFQPNNPDALPVAFEFMKSSFTKTKEQWSACVGLANGLLDQGQLQLPQIEFVLNLFVLGLQKAGVLEGESDEAKLAHIQTWPFIAASLDARGTAFPYWFLIRKTDNLSQLKSYLNKAAKYSKGNLPERLTEVNEGIDCLLQQKNLSSTSKLKTEMDDFFDRSEDCYEKLPSVASKQRGTERDPGLELEAKIDELVANTSSLGNLLNKLVLNEYKLTPISRSYWMGKIIEGMNSEHDKASLVKVLRSKEHSTKHTGVRKAIRLIDFFDDGPS